MDNIEVYPLEVRQTIGTLGQNVRRARVRRRMSQESLAQACQITRKTLYAIETGAPGIAVGTLFSVLWALGLLDSAAHLADPDQDEHGKVLEAARQPKRVRQAVIDNDF
jgi:DNA-binding XRE family transcriptional regulator